ncbi:MAG: SulP family inorganic anion transporter [Anaerolineae bacterium]|nr:SulP family inorganic anion transporter [Anaerolineae bacterium]
MSRNKLQRHMQQAKLPGTRLGSYFKHTLRPDLVAGLTVAMIAVPQGMSYAAIAGVNPIYGLYTAIIPAIIGSLFGSSNHLITGPTNAAALATASALLAIAGQADYFEYIFALAVMIGLVKLILGLLRLGGIVRYISNSVLTGFLAGAGILIIVNQIHAMLGLSRPVGANTLTIMGDLVQQIPRANLHVLAIGLFVIAVLVLVKRISPRLPRALMAIVLAGVLIQIFGWESHGVVLVRDLDCSLSEARLSFHIPIIPLKNVGNLIASAGAVALLGLVEAMSIAKTIALASGQRINPSREFVGQGLASLIGGFFQCIPSSGSLSRSGIAYGSGAKTQLAGVLSGVFVLLVLLAFSSQIGYIPVAGLAGVVVMSAYGLFDYHHLKLTWRSRTTSRIVLSVTFVATLLLPLYIAIYMGTLLSIGIYLYESGSIQLRYLTLNENGQVTEHSLEDIAAERPPIALINVEGTLYFAAVDDLENKLRALLQTGVKVLILRVRRLHLLASTGVIALRGIVTSARDSGATVLICGVTENLGEILASSGFASPVEVEPVFKASDILFESTSQALRRAREIIAEEE